MINLLLPKVHPERRLAIYLALIAGYVDAYTYLASKIYVSFMSGNTTATGVNVGQGKPGAATLAALAILFFLLGSIAGPWLANSKLRNPRKVLFGLIAVALAIIIVGALTLKTGLPAAALICVLAFAMALMNSTHTHIGAEQLSLTFVTGLLNKVGTHLALAIRRAPLPGAQGPWDTHVTRARSLASVWVGFLAGAIIAAAVNAHFGVWTLLPPCLILAALALASNGERVTATAATQPAGTKPN